MGILKIGLSAILSAALGIFFSAFYLINASYFTISRRAEEIVSEEVTESEWNTYINYEFFDDVLFDNCKVSHREYSLSGYYFQGQPVETENYSEEEIIFDGDLKYHRDRSWSRGKFWQVDNLLESEIYLQQIQDGGQNVYYKYIRQDGEWKKFKTLENTPSYRYTSMIGVLLKHTQYSSYEFSEEQRGYVYAMDSPDEKYVVKFTDGKLSGIWREEITFESGTYSHKVTDVVITWGEQNVTLPDVREG